MQFMAETESPKCYVPPSPEPLARRRHRGAGGCGPTSSTRVVSKEWSVTAQPSAKPLSYGHSAPHLIAHPVLKPMYLLGSDATRQILLFTATPKPPPPPLGHTVSRMTTYCLSPEKLNKIKKIK